MQKLFVFVALSLIALSCSNIEKHREAITSLATDWETTTQQVSDFSTELGNEAANWQRMYDDAFAKVLVSEKISDEAKTELEQLKQTFQTQGATYQSLQEEVGSFLTGWEEKTAEVNALKEGLETGQLSAELVEKISTLRESLDAVPANLEAWKKNLQETQRNLQATLQRQAELTQGQDS